MVVGLAPGPQEQGLAHVAKMKRRSPHQEFWKKRSVWISQCLYLLLRSLSDF